MRLRFASILALLLIGTATCADPAKFPDWPVLPTPKPDVIPQPMPGPASTLDAGEWYVVQSADEVQLLASPPGVVTVTEEAGPLKLRGKFADGNGKVETRTYEKKRVFIVERVAAGSVELALVPKGKVERRVITDGTAPIPPPKPKPDPEPVKSFRVFLIYESAATITAAQHSVLYGKVVEDYLNATCTDGKAGWRRRDKDATGDADTSTMKALWAAIQPKVTAVPCAAVEVNGKVEIIPLAVTPAEMVAEFKRYTGGK